MQRIFLALFFFPLFLFPSLCPSLPPPLFLFFHFFPSFLISIFFLSFAFFFISLFSSRFPFSLFLFFPFYSFPPFLSLSFPSFPLLPFPISPFFHLFFLISHLPLLPPPTSLPFSFPFFPLPVPFISLFFLPLSFFLSSPFLFSLPLYTPPQVFQTRSLCTPLQALPRAVTLLRRRGRGCGWVREAPSRLHPPNPEPSLRGFPATLGNAERVRRGPAQRK